MPRLSNAEKERRAAAAAGTATQPIQSDAPPAFEPSSPAIKTSRDIPDTGTVTVALKMPNGLILQLFEETVQHENVMGGGTRAVKVMQRTGQQVRLHGYALTPNSRARHLITMGNFALTDNVDAKFFKAWWEQNKDCALVKSGMIFCMASKHEAEAKADAREDLRNGMEPMAQGKDPRAGRTRNPNLTDIETADRKALAR